MGLADVLDLSSSTQRRLVSGMQAVLVVLAGYGLLTLQLGVAAPAVLSLGVTFLPAWLRREYGYSMDPGLVLWITVAVFLHTVGTLGIYTRYQWYDEITHTVSATLIAGLGYAAFRALELHSEEIRVPDVFRGVFVVVFVLSAAVAWEVFEFALGGYLVVFGIDDIVTDMIANLVGAVIVAVVTTGPVEGLVGFLRERLRAGNA